MAPVASTNHQEEGADDVESLEWAKMGIENFDFAKSNVPFGRLSSRVGSYCAVESNNGKSFGWWRSFRSEI